MIALPPQRPIEVRLAAWLETAIALGRGGPPVLRAMLGLLGELVTVELTPEVPTACLTAPATPGGPFRIRLGTGAFAERLRGPKDVLYLLAHELAHFVREDLAAAPLDLDPQASNVAADALNDAWLHGPAFDAFFDPHTSLRGRYAAWDPLGAFLMLQPSMARDLGLPMSALVAPSDALNISRAWYSHRVEPPPASPRRAFSPYAWASAHDLVQRGGRDGTMDLATATELLTPLLRQLPAPPPPPPAWVMLPAALRSASSRVRKRVGAGVAVRGQADAVDLDAFGLQTSLGVIPEALERGRGHLIEIVRRVAFDAGLDEGRAGAPLATTPTASGSCMTRRSVVDWKAGTRPTPFTRRAPSTREGQRIQLYVDVSNSMSRWLPRIVGEIGCVLEAFIEPVILAFAAGEVEPWRGHAGGLRRALTRGGTSFAPVAEDMRARGVRHALVISDGVGANPDPDCLEALARRGTRVALVFPEDAVPHPLDAISPARWRFGLGLPRIRVGYF